MPILAPTCSRETWIRTGQRKYLSLPLTLVEMEYREELFIFTQLNSSKQKQKCEILNEGLFTYIILFV